MSTELKTGYETDGGQIVTPAATGSFIYAFHPQPPDKDNPEAKPKYAITLLFDADSDLTLLKNEAARAAVEDWGEDQDKWPQNFKKPFRDQAEKQLEGYTPGCKFITVTSSIKPEVLGPSGKPITDEAQVYPGIRVRASVRAFTYKKKGNVGIAFGLSNIQKLDDGPRLGGGERAASQFRPVAPAKGGDTASGGAKKSALFDD